MLFTTFLALMHFTISALASYCVEEVTGTLGASHRVDEDSKESRILVQMRGKLGAVNEDAKQVDLFDKPHQKPNEQPNRQEYDCSVDAKDWKLAWSTAKKQFCCKTQDMACSNMSSAPPSNASAKPLAETRLASQSAQKLLKASLNKSASDEDREKAWSEFRRAWCCRHESGSCTLDCNADLGQLSWSAIKKAYCCEDEHAKNGPPPCVTHHDSLAKSSYFQGAVSDPGTPCVFGKDDRDEGYHCIMDGGKFGEFGWCYTANGWGSCSGDCPLIGSDGVLYENLRNLTRQLSEPKKQTTQNARGDTMQIMTAKANETEEEAIKSKIKSEDRGMDSALKEGEKGKAGQEGQDVKEGEEGKEGKQGENGKRDRKDKEDENDKRDKNSKKIGEGDNETSN